MGAAGTREGKYGLAVIEAKDSAAAAVFTKNKVVAAPVMHTKEMMKGGKLSLIVVNSGNANCFTGQDGIDDCNRIVEFASGLTGIPSNEIVTASTGVIGRRMPMDIILPLIEEAVPKVEHSAEASTDAAKSIINDTAILMANGKSGVDVVKDGEIDSRFQEALEYVSVSLAKMMAHDGEGATKFIECKVIGALNDEDAIKASKSVISSSLVKSAIFGGDPNWGRIAAAVGYADVGKRRRDFGI